MAAVLAAGAAAQDSPKPLDPSKARTEYSFPVRPGSEAFRFHVELDKSMTIKGFSVFRANESAPFQRVPTCQSDLPMELNEYDDGRELLQHADLDFDGFEDVQLLQYYHPHLGTSVFCIYIWDDKEKRFRYAPDIPSANPVPHPENKTITVHQDYFGGAFVDDTYRWNGGNIELIEANGMTSGNEDPNCGFTQYCMRLINGEMVTTAEKPWGCSDKPDATLDCSAPPLPGFPRKRRQAVMRQK